MPLKIAFIRYKDNPYGGAERFTQALMDSLAARGIEIHLFARKWKGAQQEGIYLHKVRGPRWPSLLGYASFVFLVGRAIAAERFDLVQSNERTLCQDLYRAGDGVHARWLELRGLRQGALRRLSVRINPSHLYRLWLERRLFESPSLKAVIVNSEMVRNEILARFRISDERIYTIYNGIDLKRFHPGNRLSTGIDLRRGCGLDESQKVVLFVGSGFERKGLSFLLRGLAIAGGDTRLWVVGKGKVGAYKKEAEELGIAHRVTFMGPQLDVAPIYAAADVFVLPTLYDPFPTVILEAMGSGLPVITTAQCGAAEVITQGHEGFVLDSSDDVHRMARYLSHLYRDDVRMEMAERARELAENFPIERTITELENLYEKLLNLPQ